MAPKTRIACALLAASLTLLAFAGLADAQQATPTAVVTVGTGAVQVVRTPMPLGAILAIAFVAAFASAVNGLVGAIFLFVIWMWLYGGALPSINLYLREQPSHPWAPHLLLPLIVFLLVWQYRLRGKIGPSWGLRHLVRQMTSRRGDQSLASS
jgi:hypothetical protein